MRIRERFLEWKESSLFDKVFSVLFAGAILVGLLTRLACIRDTKNCDQLQPELRFPDVIADVLHDEELGQIYVCYNDASYVNVYTEDGEFLWAVSIPNFRNVDFALLDGRLLVNISGCRNVWSAVLRQNWSRRNITTNMSATSAPGWERWRAGKKPAMI